MYTSVSDKGMWLSDQLPTIEFDINQNGNVRKADEAEALFCAIVVSQILKEKEFKEEITTLAKNYDFKEMKEIGLGSNSFRSILSSWQDLQSEVININETIEWENIRMLDFLFSNAPVISQAYSFTKTAMKVISSSYQIK